MKNYKKKILKTALLIIGLCIYVISLHLVDDENILYANCACFGLILECAASFYI